MLNNYIWNKIHRINFIVESKNSVLIKFKDFRVWIPKKVIKINEFDLFASVGILEDGDYLSDNGADKAQIKGKVLLEAIKGE